MAKPGQLDTPQARLSKDRHDRPNPAAHVCECPGSPLADTAAPGFVIGTIGSPEGVEYVKVTLEPSSDPPLTVRLSAKDARLLAKAIDSAFRSIEETRSSTLRRPLPGWDEQG